MNDYTIFYKCKLPINEDWGSECCWDVFLSAFTRAERVRTVFNKVPARAKHWLVFPEYGFSKDQCDPGAFVCDTRHEAEYVKEFWSKFDDLTGHSVCVDITGFIRPYLLFLMRWFIEKGVQKFDALYSEPIHYKNAEQTRFSDEAVIEVRQVTGFEGTHITDTTDDLLIIGSGYDHKLIAEVAENKDQARKVQLFGLPSLRADMYQQNVLRAHRAEEAVGTHMSDETTSFFAPANDPFVTAAVLQGVINDLRTRGRLTNLYLSPLATKPQVLGFGLYYLTECRNRPVSLIFPFCHEYEQETARGLARVWKYTVELPVS